jgi:3-hydroxyisobutyrate dehydrogenase-like beta-hydroxyacid dehydrogenase
MAKVAFLGLGVMGYPMAGHLKSKGGHEVTVYNRTAASIKAAPPRPRGLRRRARTSSWPASATTMICAR